MRPMLAKYVEGGRVDSLPLRHDNRFWDLAEALTQTPKKQLLGFFDQPIIALDPGETTGLAIFHPGEEIIYLGQLVTKPVGPGYDKLFGIINYLSLDKPSLMHCRYEDYRVYAHMLDQHSYSNLHTARVIGSIEVACHLAGVQWTNCLAQHAKAFWTDDKLKMCDLYNKGMRHARDAERHLLRFICEGTAQHVGK